jgi:hypothetical protein
MCELAGLAGRRLPVLQEMSGEEGHTAWLSVGVCVSSRVKQRAKGEGLCMTSHVLDPCRVTMQVKWMGGGLQHSGFR